MNIILARIALISALTIASGCSTSNPAIQHSDASTSDSGSVDLPKVTTAKPVKKEIAQKTDQPGQIVAYATTPIHAKVSGYIEQLNVDIGDHVLGPRRNSQGEVVEEGQLLAQISAPELLDELRQKEAALDQVRAMVDQSKAAIEVAESTSDRMEADVEESLAAEQRIQSSVDRWKSESQRVVSLATSKTVSQKLADEANAQYKSAEAERAESKARTKSMKAKQHEAKIAISKAQADFRAAQSMQKIAEADFQRIRTLGTYLQIRAPFSGVITQRNVDVGHITQAAKAHGDAALFVIVQSDRIRVRVDVPESDAGLVEVGDKAVIRIPTAPGKSYEGTLARTGWALQEGTRSLQCEIDLTNENGALRPGMYANVEITLAQKDDALTLPKAAIVQFEGKPTCLSVLDDGSLVRKQVELGIRSSTDVEIVHGLDGNEDIIAANAAAFKAGQKVKKASK